MLLHYVHTLHAAQAGVKYEHLIANTLANTRILYDFCGLDVLYVGGASEIILGKSQVYHSLYLL